MSRAIMVQGTGSNVGKSILVAGLCRAAKKRGIGVAPFKPQNMSNNAAVTSDGGEVGRAQALQAMASGLEPTRDMNPVLIKPETDTAAQIIVQGQRLARSEAKHFGALRDQLMPHILESFSRLKAHHELVIVEGAGSPAEVNLRARDMANMGFACKANVPVILAGDIDRGGVIAQIIGTKTVLSPQDRAMICGFLVNKFRGDPKLFDDGYSYIEAKTGWSGFGVVPWFQDAWRLPAEDAVDLNKPIQSKGLHIVCLALSRIANFDDLDPLSQEPNVRLTMLGPGRPLPGDTDIVIIPGTKSTRADLAFLRQQGWDIDIQAHIRRGGHVLGICGGYQMLGTHIADPSGVDGDIGDTHGLGHLDITTHMHPSKHVTRTTARHIQTGTSIDAYEIHMGRTEGQDCTRPFARLDDKTDGATSPNGRISGTYLHGLFTDDGFRKAWLQKFNAGSDLTYSTHVENTLDALASHLETHLDVGAILAAAR